MNAGVRGFAQEIETGDTEWSATLRLLLGRTFRLSGGASTRLQIGGFGRELSLDAESLPEAPTLIDQDIFTSYKADHRYGARIAQSFTVRPKRDLGLWGQISMNTNESLGDLDNAAVELALRELVGPLRLDLGVRAVRYFADDDRAEEVDRQRVSLRWAWERWTRRLGRWEIGGRANYDFRAKQYSGTLFLSRHFSAGRGLDVGHAGGQAFGSCRSSRPGSTPCAPSSTACAWRSWPPRASPGCGSIASGSRPTLTAPPCFCWSGSKRSGVDWRSSASAGRASSG